MRSGIVGDASLSEASESMSKLKLAEEEESDDDSLSESESVSVCEDTLVVADDIDSESDFVPRDFELALELFDWLPIGRCSKIPKPKSYASNKVVGMKVKTWIPHHFDV